MRKFIAASLLCILLAVLLFGCLGTQEETGVGQLVKKDICVSELENFLDKYSKDLNFSGTVLIAVNGQKLLEKGYGMADYDKGIKNNPAPGSLQVLMKCITREV